MNTSNPLRVAIVAILCAAIAGIASPMPAQANIKEQPQREDREDNGRGNDNAQPPEERDRRAAARIAEQLQRDRSEEARRQRQGSPSAASYPHGQASQHSLVQAVRQQRLDEAQRQARIRDQQQNITAYRRSLAQQQALTQAQTQALQRQNRRSYLQYQQEYYDRLRQQQMRWQDDNYSYDNDPYYYTAARYRYNRDGQYYETNQYGVDVLRQALNHGYQEGYRAGQADQRDRWRFSFRDSYAYQDANYGFSGRYVRQADYNHYFRSGFERGYEDGYYSRRTYGHDSNGSNMLLGAVLTTLLNLQFIR